MATRVFDTDTWFETGQKCFYAMDVHQIVVVKGLERIDEHTILEKGKLVLEELERLDKLENFNNIGAGRMRRKKVKPVNTIGGELAHKIFKWKREVIENEPRYTIWRLQ